MSRALEAKLRLAQEQRVTDRLKAGESMEFIAAAEGVVLSTINNLRKRLKLTVKKGKTPKKPHGLTANSSRIRGYLGPRLKDQVAGGLHWMEVAAATGIPRNQQKVAGQNPFDHDWKLSEIERLAQLMGVPLHELLLRAMQPPVVGFGSDEERKEWNRTLARLHIGP